MNPSHHPIDAYPALASREPKGLSVETGLAAKGATPPGTRSSAAAPRSSRAEPRCAVWSDGTLVIERIDGEVLRFEPVEARPIINYLRRAWLEPGAVA